MRYRQARWNEPLIFELTSDQDRETFQLGDDYFAKLGKKILTGVGEITRKQDPNIPNLSEPEVVRHYTRLTQMSYGIDVGVVPLGSCTMKYNPKICEDLANDERIIYAHPYMDEEYLQGLLEILYTLQEWLAELTGMDVCSLHPPAGAAGELAGVLIIRKYIQDKGYKHKDEILIPESAHGTNPASAAMAGFKVVRIPTDDRGNTDLNALRSAVSDKTAGIMLTNPSTLGLFEEEIVEISSLIHSKGGLLYYDGANLNGILGIARPGDMGFDIVHLNLHKTFAAPHGGGGPGAGAICVKKELVDYLPKPLIRKGKDGYYMDYDIKKSIGRITWFYGNIVPAVKSFIYLMMLGSEIREVAEVAVLNTNYFMKKVQEFPGVDLIYGYERWRKHEVVISFDRLHRETGVSAEDVAKALLDRGIHAPTIYFPLIVPEAHMVEFTESESKRTIDEVINAYRDIIRQAHEDPTKLKEAPRNTSVSRLDVLRANHPKTLAPTYKYFKKASASK